MGLDPADPLLQLLRRSGAEVAGFGQLDETMQRPGWWIAAVQANCKKDMDFSISSIFLHVLYIALVSRLHLHDRTLFCCCADFARAKFLHACSGDDVWFQECLGRCQDVAERNSSTFGKRAYGRWKSGCFWQVRV